jgi:ribosomal protein S8
MNDPLGDMLTRIRNAQMRGKSTVRTPASKLRAWVLDVLVEEGYIRGYESTTDARGHAELEISLKYFDGTPVIRELKRVSKPGSPRLCRRQGHPLGAQRAGCFGRLHAQGRDVGCSSTRRQCWRRSALPVF